MAKGKKKKPNPAREAAKEPVASVQDPGEGEQGEAAAEATPAGGGKASERPTRSLKRDSGGAKIDPNLPQRGERESSNGGLIFVFIILGLIGGMVAVQFIIGQ